ncbi:MAG: hypothetical protein GXN99_02070 [Candidatus Nanohaloarchaeota archaeon]|nr:hypothetical protein [Candidatus Nanohaloarchaeota archaeon]
MEVLEERDVKLQLVRTKKGSLLYRILISEEEGWFFLEQNPLKESKYGYAYRSIKSRFPDFYMFWEFKRRHYTGKILLSSFLKKPEIDPFVSLLLTEEQLVEFNKREDKSKEESEERLKEIE